MSLLKNIRAFEKFVEKYNRRYFYSALFDFYCAVAKLDRNRPTADMAGTKDSELVVNIDNPRIKFGPNWCLEIDKKSLNSIPIKQAIDLLKELANDKK
jgi:hypothetical protein